MALWVEASVPVRRIFAVAFADATVARAYQQPTRARLVASSDGTGIRPRADQRRSRPQEPRPLPLEARALWPVLQAGAFSGAEKDLGNAHGGPAHTPLLIEGSRAGVTAGGPARRPESGAAAESPCRKCRRRLCGRWRYHKSQAQEPSTGAGGSPGGPYSQPDGGTVAFEIAFILMDAVEADSPRQHYRPRGSSRGCGLSHSRCTGRARL